jgi:hypothetical protein
MKQKPPANLDRGLSVFRARLGLACAVLALLCIGGPSHAQQGPGTSPAVAAAPVSQYNGNRIQMPQGFAVSRYSGVTLAIDPRWTNSYGYQPVEITVTAAKVLKRDRVIRIQLHTGWMTSVGAEQVFELPAGSTTATATMSLPVFQAATNSYRWWDVWVDGVKDKDLTADRNSPVAWTNRSSGVQSNLSFLVAGPPQSHRSLVATNATEFEVLSLELPKFPTRWIDYEGLDVVALSRADMETLRTKHPDIFSAICRWVRAGGQLWVGDAGQQLENLPQISKQLRVSEYVVPLDSPAAADTSTEKPAEKSAAATSAESQAAPAAASDEPQEETDQADEVQPPKVERGWRSLRFRRGTSDGRVVTFFDSRVGTRRTTRDPVVISRLQRGANVVIAEEGFV